MNSHECERRRFCHASNQLRVSVAMLGIVDMAAKLAIHKPTRITIPNPTRPKALLKKERGLRVYQGEPTDASVTAVIDRERKKRLRELIG